MVKMPLAVVPTILMIDQWDGGMFLGGLVQRELQVVPNLHENQ